jgi:hypothetical protein
VGAATIGYLQQPLPSQQAGLSQHVKTLAAWADKESERNAANANASTLNFITSPFERVAERYRTPDINVLLRGKGDDLNAKVVFEIEYRTSVMETWT